MGCFGPVSNEPEQTVPKEFNDANIRAARRFKAERDVLVKALETAAARFNLMAGVGLVNGADPKVGYRECMDALASVGGSRE